MSHTKGPWVADRSTVICEDGSVIGRTYFSFSSKDKTFSEQFEESEANARLMAAATEMLEVLEELIITSPFRGVATFNIDMSAVQEKARNVITKVKGGADE